MPPSLKLPIFLISVVLSLCFVKGVSAATNVYYSVGQSTADLQTSTSTVSVSSGVATFSVAQTGNIGVGDRVSIMNGTGTTTVYISGKTSGTVWSVVTATGTAPADISATTTLAINREFTSLNAAVSAAGNSSHINNTDLTVADVVLNLPCYYDSGPDTAEVTVSGYTTATTTYINIYTPASTSAEANINQRNSGKWDDNKYHLRTSNNASIGIWDSYVRIAGLQVHSSAVDADNEGAILARMNDSGSSEIFIINNILRGPGDAKEKPYIDGYQVYSTTPTSTSYVFNNIIYDFANTSRGGGIANWDARSTMYAYNNTVYNGTKCFYNDDGITVLKNNIAFGCADGYGREYFNSISFDASSDFNISHIAGDAPNATFATTSKKVIFADAANKDFHLSPADTSAKNAGADLGADASLSFSTDIDGQTRRTNSWSIGADEGANAVYYSVGQNTTDHKTGSATLTINGGTGTFSVAQTATNMGVGDKVTYGSPAQTAYISKKIDTSNWSLVTATGTISANVTATSVASIAHVFSSLSSAITGSDDTGYMDSTDLLTDNYQLHIPCYYDSGPNTSVVTVTGYTTGPSNYIRVYTPKDTLTEANQTQRHYGKWDDFKYVLATVEGGDRGSIDIYSDYVKIEGLQIKATHSSSHGHGIRQVSGSGQIDISENVVVGSISGNGTYNHGIEIRASIARVWNNIVYGWGTGTNQGGMCTGYMPITTYFYNNTISNSGHGIKKYDTGAVVAKNNIVQDASNSLGYQGVFEITSDYNISDIAGDAPNATFATTSKTVIFVDASNDDFHLSSLDTSAKGFGANLSADPYLNFSTDIDGGQRTGNWDIGADEFDGVTYHSPEASESSATSTVEMNTTVAGRLTDGLVGHWTFDGPHMNWALASAEARDQSGRNNNGDVVGPVVTIGKLGQALEFDGVDDYLHLGSPASLTDMDVKTISAWINIDSFGQNSTGRIMDKEGNSADGWLFYVNNGVNCNSSSVAYIHHGLDAGFGEWCTPTSSIAIDNWYHAAVVYDRTSYTNDALFYINGEMMVTTEAFAPPAGAMKDDNTRYIRIGNSGATRWFDGKIDDVRIYNRALSAEEIFSLYNMNKVEMTK